MSLHLPLGDAGDFSHPEALLYVDCHSLAACDRHHQEILLPDTLRDGRTHQLALHGWTGLGDWLGREPHTQLFMRACAVVLIDQPTRDFVATVRVALGIANQLDDGETAKEYLYSPVANLFYLLDTREPHGRFFYDSIATAHQALLDDIARAGRPLDVTITASGHTHIDLAWLWPVAQTRRKAGRTFHTVLHLMRRFFASDVSRGSGEGCIERATQHVQQSVVKVEKFREKIENSGITSDIRFALEIVDATQEGVEEIEANFSSED